MVSNAKRMKYVSDNENDFSSSEIESGDDSDSKHVSGFRGKVGRKLIKNLQYDNKPTRRPTRTPKSFSRNALIARENRLKKKIYMEKLEKEVNSLKMENKKLSTVVDNQSFLIGDLKKQVKYLKSVISNSADISRLLSNIRQNTGMSVRAPLDNKLPLKNDLIPKRNQIVAGKVPFSWEQTSEPFIDSSCKIEDEFVMPLLDVPTDLPDFNLLNDVIEEDAFKSPLEEHDYTFSSDLGESLLKNDEDDVGVCLHVSKHRVSLEFCATCSENATNSWSDH